MTLKKPFIPALAYEKMNKNLRNNKGGYITLISVLIVGAVAIAITTSMLLLGLGSSRTSFALEHGYQAKALANLCVEEALQQMRDFTPFSGTNNLSAGQGICTYTVTNTGGQNRLITAQGTVGTIVRKISINVNTINPKINGVSWQGVADF